MEGYEKCPREKRSHHHACKNPSFSSTLLDAIYRSIDHEQGLDHHHHDHDQRFAVYDEEEERQRQQQQQELFFYQQTTRKKQSSRAHHHHHACMQSCHIDQWLEKKSADEKPATLRWSDFQDGFLKPTKDHHPTFFNSTSTSSDSSCGGGFSSSETESIYGRRHSSSSAYSRHHPNPIPTTTHNKTQQIPHIYIPPPSTAAANEQKKKTSKQDGFIKNKSRTASKIYNELKKARQPISPGGRLASFLNSIFAAAGHAKKAKILSSSASIDGPNDMGYDRKSKSAQASTCSSASSFSRSCLSKTPSSRGGKPINGGGAKRSVRFLIVDEDGRPCGGGNDELKIRLVENNKRVEEAAKEMLKEYQLKKRERLEEVIRAVHHSNQDVDDDEEDDDDDAGSCSSSDLFELENLTAIGMERYREELPVYETTHLGTNRAIANGLIL